MTHKKPKGSAAEVLAGRDFEKMLRTLIETGIYDYIFMEGSAINDYSDTLELSSFSDKLILVFNAMSEFTTADRHSLTSLTSLENKLMGGILNQATSQV